MGSYKVIRDYVPCDIPQIRVLFHKKRYTPQVTLNHFSTPIIPILMIAQNETFITFRFIMKPQSIVKMQRSSYNKSTPFGEFGIVIMNTLLQHMLTHITIMIT